MRNQKDLKTIIILSIIIVVLFILIIIAFGGNKTNTNATSENANQISNDTVVGNAMEFISSKGNYEIKVSNDTTIEVKPELYIKKVTDVTISIAVGNLQGLTNGIQSISYGIVKFNSGERPEYVRDETNDTAQSYTFKNLEPETRYKVYVEILDNNNNVISLENDNITTEKT